jgi:hypothetical protein
MKTGRPGEAAQSPESPVGPRDHNRLLALILVNVVAASATRRMAVLATSLWRVVVVIVGAVGQTMRTTAGMESGWMSSMLSVSPERLIVPAANWTGDDWDKADSYSF